MPEVELRADDARPRVTCPDATPATDEDFEREFLDLILAVKVVDSLDEAIAHVARLRHRATARRSSPRTPRTPRRG